MGLIMAHSPRSETPHKLISALLLQTRIGERLFAAGQAGEKNREWLKNRDQMNPHATAVRQSSGARKGLLGQARAVERD
jgi:hypothetical protein